MRSSQEKIPTPKPSQEGILGINLALHSNENLSDKVFIIRNDIFSNCFPGRINH